MRKSFILLALVALACALSATWSWSQLRAKRERVAALEQQLRAARTATPAAPALAMQVNTAPQLEPQAPPSVPKVPTRSPDAADAVQDANHKELRQQVLAAQQREREMMRDPAYREARMADWRRRYAQARAEAIRVLGLTPEQADRFIDLSIERNFAGADLAGFGGGPLNEEAQAEWKRINEQHETRLRELLGEEKYQRWQWNEKSAAERNEVAMLGAQLSTTATPLQQHQVDVLVDALYVERRRRDREYDAYATAAGITNRYVVAPQDRQRWIDLEKASNQRIHDSVSGTLTRAQLVSLDAMLAANVAPVEAALRLQLEGKMAKSN